MSSYPEPSRRRISPAGGEDPTWSPSGDELYYWRDGNTLMVVDMTSPTEPGNPEVLFTRPYYGRWQRNYDVTPDGQFLLVEEIVPRPKEIRLVLNWFEELRQLPAGR